MTTTTKTSDILTSAADIILQKGWIKGRFHRRGEGYCMIGGVLSASGISDDTLNDPYFVGDDKYGFFSGISTDTLEALAEIWRESGINDWGEGTDLKDDAWLAHHVNDTLDRAVGKERVIAILRNKAADFSKQGR